MVLDDGQSYTEIVKASRAQKDEREAAAHEKSLFELEQQKKQEEIENQEDRTISQRRRRVSQPTDDFFDWSFWGLCLCFSLMAYVRIRLEPTLRRNQRRSLAQMALNDEASAAQTLRRINREREARGETPISLEAYQTLRMVLLRDRSLLQGLAGQTAPPPQRGATPEQLETCQQLIIREGDDYEGECCICLASFETDDQVRILPCSHAYHAGCVDRWLEQSTLCPLCKSPLSETNNS